MKKEEKKKILVIYTGGTIGSIRITLPNGQEIKGQPTELKEKYPEFRDYIGSTNATILYDTFIQKYPLYKDVVDISNKLEMETLSENMTLISWNELIKKLQKYDFNKYDGIIITHGTDTLGYSANLISMIYSCTEKPIFMVSSNDSLDKKDANGIPNFKAAIDFIINYGYPGVYVSYKSRKNAKVIYASRVTQCKQILDDFESISFGKFMPLGLMSSSGSLEVKDHSLFNSLRNNSVPTIGTDLNEINSNVLKISPYVGLNYSNFNLTGVDAILHTCYHSGTSSTAKNYYYSILEFINRCKDHCVDFYYGPVYGEEDKALYDTTLDVMNSGAHVISNISEENAYVKLVMAYSMGLRGKEVEDFLSKDVNHEHIRRRIKK